MRLVLRLLGTAVPAILLTASLVPAADAKKSHSFRVAIDSQIVMDLSGKKQKIDAATKIDYTWKQQGNERTLVFDSMQVEAKKDGKAVMNTFMSRAKFTNTADGKTQELTFDKAPDELKKMLKDSFDVPVCKLQVDGTGKEIKREVLAGPGAKALVDQGMIQNALLFHPPFPADKNEWTAPAQISMGNGGFAKGDLTYKKVPGGKGKQVVKVSGTLTNDGFKLPNSPVTIKNARYVVTGEQTYDTAAGEWVAGKLDLDVSFEMTADDKALATAKGKMATSLESIPKKK